jgi:transcriptional regulator with XRE-family HTH domain
MKIKKTILMPRIERILVEVGENVKLARLRRKLSAEQVAERANTTRPTLRSIEQGSGSVTIGVYAQVLFVLGMEKDLLKLAGDDPLGRRLQDANLLVKERAPKKPRKND